MAFTALSLISLILSFTRSRLLLKMPHQLLLFCLVIMFFSFMIFTWYFLVFSLLKFLLYWCIVLLALASTFLTIILKTLSSIHVCFIKIGFLFTLFFFFPLGSIFPSLFIFLDSIVFCILDKIATSSSLNGLVTCRRWSSSISLAWASASHSNLLIVQVSSFVFSGSQMLGCSPKGEDHSQWLDAGW